MARRYDQYCALATSLDVLGDRWTLLVLRELWSGPKRFSALAQGLVDVPTNVLSNRLKSMVEQGLIQARVPSDDRRGRVYDVSPEARAGLGEVLMALTRFGMAHMSDDPVGTRHFHPDWLVMPLEAALRRDAVLAPVTVLFSCGDEAALFEISPNGVLRVEEAAVDVTVAGTADALLRAVRAPRDIDGLVRAGDLAITGEPAAIASLARAFASTSL